MEGVKALPEIIVHQISKLKAVENGFKF